MKKQRNNKPTFWKLFWLFLKISFLSFGGGNAIFPMIRNYCVNKYGWLNDQDIDDALIITNAIPGASSVEAITFVAYKLLNSKWKAFAVTTFSLIPHCLLFFGMFFIAHKFLPMKYLKIIYVAIIPIIIALLINMSIRYIKYDVNSGMPNTIHWFIFVITTAFCVFVPVPWNIPVLIIVFFFICLIVYKWIKKRKDKKDKKNG